MTRLWKIVTAVVVVAVALTAGWFLTRPSTLRPGNRRDLASRDSDAGVHRAER